MTSSRSLKIGTADSTSDGGVTCLPADPVPTSVTLRLKGKEGNSD